MCSQRRITVWKSSFSGFGLTALVLSILILHAVFPEVTAIPPETHAPPQALGTTLSYNFDMEIPGGMPAKFHAALTGQGSEGKWAVMADPTAPSKPNVVAQTSTYKTAYRFPLLISDEGSFKEAGKIGLWIKADSVTYFDDLVAKAK